MSYKIIVEFDRDLSDDANCIGKVEPTPKEYAEQLARELQSACNDGLAGNFQVITVKLGDKHYDWNGVSEFNEV